MRHSRHYVDEVLGDQPLRTVREIPVDEIELPEQTEQLEAFESFDSSIRQFGVLEPLLVGRSGAQYRVIAGMRRLHAARRLGLGTVPCLVHEVDDDKLRDMREAAMQRLTAPSVPSAPQAAPDEPMADVSEQGLDLMSTLLPPLNDAATERLRWGVLTDLAGIELLRAKTENAASHILSGADPIHRAPVDCGSLLADVIESIATEARFRSVRIDATVAGAHSGVSLDSALCRTAMSGIFHALLSIAPRVGTVLAVHAQITTVRPALIVQCMLKECDQELGREALLRFFDAGWADHPSGAAGAQMLAAAAKVARLHGGRVDVQTRAPRGCVAIFVVPRPLTDV